MNRVNLIRLLLLGLILAAFGRCVLNDFVDWDDGALIYLNPNINQPTLHTLAAHWHPSDKNNHEMYNPLVFSFWWVLAHGAMLSDPDITGSPLNPELFHAANLLFHWINVCLVLELLRKVRIPLWPAAAGAAFFAIHPIQTEPVVWAASMKDLLSTFFALLSILCYLNSMEREPRRQRFGYALATLLYVLSLLCKPSTVVIALILPVFDILLFHRPARRSIALMIPWAVLGAGALLITRSIQPTNHIDVLPLVARPLVAADTLSFYFYKLILPINLSSDYGRNPNALVTNPQLFHPLYWTWIFPVLIAAIIWRVRQPMVTAGALIFLFGVCPVLGFINFGYQFFSTPADRYMYVPMIGLAMIVGWAVNRFASRATIIILCIVAVVFCSLDFMQTGVWADSDTLYTWAVNMNHVNSLHYLILARQQDREAKAALARSKLAASEHDTESTKAEFDQSMLYLNKAIESAQTAVSLAPLEPDNYDALSNYLSEAGRFSEAIKVVKDWIAVQPRLDDVTRSKPEMLHATLGMVYTGNKQYDDAIREYGISLKIKEDPSVERKLAIAVKARAASSRPVASNGS